ncbi:MAG: glycoside hydrolase family 3 protein [Acidobacteriales bacterium]|nr:glycoside hydrolase family 3 protein [Terriglobales bacterium]
MLLRLRLALILLTFSVSALAKDFQRVAPLQETSKARKWAEKRLRKLSLEQKVGQMFMTRAFAEFLNVNSPEFLRLRDEIRSYHIGSVILTVRVDGPFLQRNQPYEAAMFTNRLQRESQLPLLFAADFERGLSMRLYGATVFPHAMAFGAAGDPQFAAGFGEISAQESRAIGVHWNFFPVADVNSNPANPIINTRAFSEDPAQVSDLLAAYIRAARNAGMLTTAKHFPGHGDTSTDSHLELARVDSSKAELEKVELAPFRRAIEAGVDSMMIAHVTVPALEPDPKRVASTSPAVIKDVLQSQLGFKGLIVPDAMEMNAVTRLFDGQSESEAAGRAAVEAIKAGNDMILIPAELEGAFNGVVNAVRSGEIPQAQIDGSVRKILTAKAMVGLDKGRLIDVEALDKIIATPEHVAFGQSVADAAVTLVRDNRKLLPLRKPGENLGTRRPGPTYQAPRDASGRTALLIFSDDVRSESGRLLEREMRARNQDTRVLYVDHRIAGPMTEQVLQMVSQAQSVVAAVYLIPTAGRMARVQGVLQGSASMTDTSAELLRRVLREAGNKTVVVAMGTPYLASSFPDVQTYMCTFSNASVAEIAAVKALYGEIEIRGKLPVSIPGIAARGSGLARPAAAAAASVPAAANR